MPDPLPVLGATSLGSATTLVVTPLLWLALIAFPLGVLLSTLSAAIEAIPLERLKAVRDTEEHQEAATALRLLTDIKKVRARLLVGRIVAVCTLAIVVAYTLAPYGWVWLVVGAHAIVIVYGAVAEFCQTAARNNADHVALRLYRLCYPIEVLIAPLAMPLVWAAKLADRWLPQPEDSVGEDIAEREMEHLIEKREEEGAISEEYAQLLRRVLEFKETVAREVMVPRTQMVAIDANMPMEAIVRKVLEEGHSRYPVYRERIDKIEGILYAKDLFAAIREKREPILSKLLRKSVFFAPETMRIGHLLREMQVRRVHLAVVLDEFGGTAGIVTLEDILEEIVGEIQDEHDGDEALVVETGPGRFLVDGRVSIHDLAEQLGATDALADEDGTYDSLGGFIVDTLGHVPKRGESLVAFGYDFQVRDADDRRVIKVEIRRRPSTRPPSRSESLRSMPAALSTPPGERTAESLEEKTSAKAEAL